MIETTDIEIWFTYSVQKKRDPASRKKNATMQLHGLNAAIVMERVPLSEIVDGKPSGSVLWAAEREFLQNAREIEAKLSRDVIYWEAKLNSDNGIVLSSFSVLTPCVDD